MVAVLIGTAGLTALVIFNFLWNAIGLSLHLIQRPHGLQRAKRGLEWSTVNFS